MMTKISRDGRVTIPQPVRERQKLRAGDEFILLEQPNGDMVLRRHRQPKHSLVWHLRRLNGLNLNRK